MEQAGFIDLHTHTRYSDGGLTPAELVQKAKEYGLAAIAITDHDTVAGIPEALMAGQRLGVEVIPGIELTAHEDADSEYHFLGYFIDYQNAPLLEHIKFYQAERNRTAAESIKSLNGLGYQVELEAVQRVATGVIIKPHIAHVVIEKEANQGQLEAEFGFKPTTGQFIQKYLVPGAPAYHERQVASPQEAIDMLHGAGGLVALAHPCWDAVRLVDGRYFFDDNKVLRLKGLGLDALEIFAHRDEEGVTKVCVDHFQKVATDLKLKVTGGSDFHGFGSGGKDLGFNDFYLKVPYAVLEQLKG